MSAILSPDDLNDFISPGVACIKPVETLPLQPANTYEVITEDKLPPPPAQISLTDCLACSGCVTSAEAVLVSLQSHSEVLSAIDSYPPISHDRLRVEKGNELFVKCLDETALNSREEKLFVASVSPQVRASLAATYGISEQEAGWMIEQLLCGPSGLASGGKYGNKFTWVVDTNAMREISLVLGAEEVQDAIMAPVERNSFDGDDTLVVSPKIQRTPLITSACPGWICYAEKTHPHILPHLSKLKSPQSLTGTLLKSVLSKALRIDPSNIWHLAIMPCFDKKLEASRQELTNTSWQPAPALRVEENPVRDVDCVITAREILMLADSRGISFPSLPRKPLNASIRVPFPDSILDVFLFPPQIQDSHLSGERTRQSQASRSGSSGGYLYYILLSQQSKYPGSTIRTERGRNSDVVDYSIVRDDVVLFRGARYYGFRNIQNLVRKLKPAKTSRMPGGKAIGARKHISNKPGDFDYAYVEVMACPGGCTNGGGQIKLDDVGSLQGLERDIKSQKEWLSLVDEAYYSMESGAETNEADDLVTNNFRSDLVNGLPTKHINEILRHWVSTVGIDKSKLVFTSYRKVESDVGKAKGSDINRVAELAGKIGGGW